MSFVVVLCCSLPALAQFDAVRMQPPGVALSTFIKGADGPYRIGYEFTFPSHGFVWTGSDPNAQDFGAGSTIHSISGNQFGGSLNARACVWTESVASRVDLCPTTASVVDAISGSQQVGSVFDGGSNSHATLWNGSSSTQVDLSPAGFLRSFAIGTDGTRQFGWGADPAGRPHALVWNGTAASMQDFTPPQGTAQILGVGGGAQVGAIDTHATIWHGTPESAIDLNPPGYLGSLCEGTNGAAQVGFVNVVGGNHAALWLGSAASFIDLHAFLPAAYSTSEATSVTIDNGRLVIGGYASTGGLSEAFIWVAVPTPATAAPLLALVGFAVRRHR
jgi:hypothetical protein